MKTYEDFKAELQAKMDKELELHKITLELSDTFKGIKYNVFDTFICIDLQERKELAVVLNRFKPSNSTTEISWAGGKNKEIVIDTPYGFTTESRIQNNGLGHLRYQSEGRQIWIRFDVDWLKEFTTVGTRSVTDSEHHYFGGVSMPKIREMRIRCWHWKKKEKAFYGGDYKLIDADEAYRVVEYLTSTD